MPPLPARGMGRAQRNPSYHLNENTGPERVFHHVFSSLPNAQLDVLGCLSCWAQPQSPQTSGPPSAPLTHLSQVWLRAFCLQCSWSAHWLCACVKPVVFKCRPLDQCGHALLKYKKLEVMLSVLTRGCHVSFFFFNILTLQLSFQNFFGAKMFFVK